MRQRDLFDLAGKTALVTGAGAGMGRAICEALAEYGADVACADLDSGLAQETADLLEPFGNRTLAIEADVFDEPDIQRMVARTRNELGRVDIVFAHAAIVDTTPAKIHELSVRDWDQVASRYTRGLFILMRTVFPLMMNEGGGKFITTAAGTALWPLPQIGDLHLATAYITGKTAAIMLTKLAARQYGEHGIRANVICPGYHRTRHHMQDGQAMDDMEQLVLQATPMKRVGLADDIKGLAVYLASDASSFVTGQVFVEDGGFSA
jgi:NAD(P)-dependent dehydrogenase (short-subunit alcohol dehydrogenase family)